MRDWSTSGEPTGPASSSIDSSDRGARLRQCNERTELTGVRGRGRSRSRRRRHDCRFGERDDVRLGGDLLSTRSARRCEHDGCLFVLEARALRRSEYAWLGQAHCERHAVFGAEDIRKQPGDVYGCNQHLLEDVAARNRRTIRDRGDGSRQDRQISARGSAALRWCTRRSRLARAGNIGWPNLRTARRSTRGSRRARRSRCTLPATRRSRPRR